MKKHIRAVSALLSGLVLCSALVVFAASGPPASVLEMSREQLIVRVMELQAEREQLMRKVNQLEDELRKLRKPGSAPESRDPFDNHRFIQWFDGLMDQLPENLTPDAPGIGWSYSSRAREQQAARWWQQQTRQQVFQIFGRPQHISRVMERNGQFEVTMLFNFQYRHEKTGRTINFIIETFRRFSDHEQAEAFRRQASQMQIIATFESAEGFIPQRSIVMGAKNVEFLAIPTPSPFDID